MEKSKKKKKVYFVKIRTIQNVFTYKNYLSLPPKESFATKSEPYLLATDIIRRDVNNR